MTGNSNEPVRKRVTILGSTGSVGLSTLDVIGRNSGQYQVFALTANTNATLLAEQCRQYRPRFAVLCDEAAARQLRALLAGSELATEILVGPAGLNQVAAHADTDYVMAGIVGAAGLASALAAVEAGKRMLLANKEALVMSGSLFMQAVRTRQSTLLPIDSEHNAIFQSMANGAATHATGIRKILLTGSGGPFATTAACADVTGDP